MQPTTVHVFVSSTALDLQPERRAIESALQRFRELKFVGMEYFGSRDDTPREASVAEVDLCQLYVGVFGGRYGSGITEAEYRRARERKMPCLVYCQAEAAIDAQWKEVDPDKADRLQALKDELRRNHIAVEVSSPQELAAKLTADLHRWLVDTIYMPAAKRAAGSDYPLDRLQTLLRDVRALGSDRSGAEVRGAVHAGDVVFSILTEAPASFAQHFRVEQFRTLIDERTRSFVGRDFIFEAIDDYLSGGDDDFQSGYVVIRGEPGIGKTALAGQMVRLRGYLHHFNVATQNIRSVRDFLGNVCSQLIVRYKLSHAALPPSATQDSGFLSQLLAEAAEKANGEPIVIVVDALDEAEDTDLAPGANRLYLPPVLSRGVFFIVTTREKDEYRLLVDRRKDIYIQDTGQQNLADVRVYIERFIDAHRARMSDRLASWHVDEATFADTLTEKSQGNFMYLVHVLRDIRDGSLTLATIDSLDDMPKGLQAYYQRHWRTMRRQDPARFQDYYEPVVCILASAREAVPIAQLVEWTKRLWPHLDGTRIREVIQIWREFLNTDRSAQGPALYRVYHASFQDFLKEEVGLARYHEEIAMTALRKIPGFLDATPQ
jgi:hypothetical protein